MITIRNAVWMAALIGPLSLAGAAGAQGAQTPLADRAPLPAAQPSQPPGYGQPPYGQLQPPGYGQPQPPGYGQSLGYGQPPGYPAYAYPPMFPIAGPRTLPYREGAPPPPGYRIEVRMNRGLAITGASILGGAWLISALSAGTILSTGDNDSEDFVPLLLPVAGPFATIGTAEEVSFENDSERVGAVVLLVDGITQLTGAVLLVAGLTSEKNIWVRDDIPQRTGEAAPQPEVFITAGGGAVRLRF